MPKVSSSASKGQSQIAAAGGLGDVPEVLLALMNMNANRNT